MQEEYIDELDDILSDIDEKRPRKGFLESLKRSSIEKANEREKKHKAKDPPEEEPVPELIEEPGSIEQPAIQEEVVDNDAVEETLDSEYINETEEKPPASFIKRNKRTIIITVSCAAAMIILFIAGIYMNKRTSVPQVSQEELEKAQIIEKQEQVKERVSRQIDETLLSQYRFLLYGTHKAADIKEGTVEFTFDKDNNFYGYSTAEADDFGTYELKTEDGRMILTIECEDATDVYEVEFSEQQDIVLKNGDTIFSLYED